MGLGAGVFEEKKVTLFMVKRFERHDIPAVRDRLSQSDAGGGPLVLLGRGENRAGHHQKDSGDCKS
jgi:hypothetical protein